MHRLRGNHVVTQATEHKAVLDCCKRLEREGFRVTVLPVDGHGRVTPEQVADALTEQTILVSIMAANNEIGTLQPIRAIGRLCKERGVYFHTDAAQAAGKVPLDVEDLGVDLLSLSGHKMYGPKGIGALYVRRRNPRVRLDALIEGGGHENGLRSGTLPVPLVVGFGKACELCREEMPREAERLRTLAGRLQRGILEQLEEVSLNGHPTERLPGNVNLSFAYVHSDALMMSMPGVAVSSGSACTSASVEPSYVLRALGLADELAQGSLRFGVGRFTTEAEVDAVVAAVVAAVRRLRHMSPLYELARQGVDARA
jgi:cysteine desulfurase